MLGSAISLDINMSLVSSGQLIPDHKKEKNGEENKNYFSLQ
jgi:hypothetical protein